jgi:hypothetical protein
MDVVQHVTRPYREQVLKQLQLCAVQRTFTSRLSAA